MGLLKKGLVVGVIALLALPSCLSKSSNKSSTLESLFSSGGGEGDASAEGGTIDPVGDGGGDGPSQPSSFELDMTDDPWVTSISDEKLIYTGSLGQGTTTVGTNAQRTTFTFSGDETLTYEVEHGPGSAVAKGAVVIRELTTDTYPIERGNVIYRNASGNLQSNTYLENFTTIESLSVGSDSLTIDYIDSLPSKTLRRRHFYEIEGKAIRVTITATTNDLSFNDNYAGFEVGERDVGGTHKIVEMQGTLATPIVAFKKSGQLYFTSSMLDLLWSNASDWNFLDPSDPQKFTYTTRGKYKKNSAGQISALLNESVMTVVSNKLEDTFVRSNYQVSPYKDLAGRRSTIRLSNGEDKPWSHFATILDEVDEFGLDNVNFYFFNFWSGSDSEGPDAQNVGPDWAPEQPIAGENLFDDFVALGLPRGYLMGAYTYFGGMPTGDIAVSGGNYEGTILMQENCTNPAAPFTDYSNYSADPDCPRYHIVRDENGQPKIGNFSDWPSWELASDTAILEHHIEREMEIMKGGYTNSQLSYLGPNEAHGYRFNLLFVDVQTYQSPSKGKDHIDQMADSPWAKTLRKAILDRKTWFREARGMIKGPLFGEGSIATRASNQEWMWATQVDSVQRVINTGSDQISGKLSLAQAQELAPTHWQVIPEYENRVSAAMQAHHGHGFGDRFFSVADGPSVCCNSNGHPFYPLSEAATDLYRVFQFTYLHNSDFSHNGNFPNNYLSQKDRIKAYYMATAALAKMRESEIDQILYLYSINGVESLRTFGAVLNHNFTTSGLEKFKHPRLKFVFKDGTIAYMNHSSAPWEVSFNNVDYRLPENGFVVAHPESGLVSFYASVKNNGSYTEAFDYAFAPNEYEFMDGRGSVSTYGSLVNSCKKMMFLNFVRNKKLAEGGASCGNSLNVEPITSDHPTVVALELQPSSIKMIEKQEVGVRAIATYSNGAKRDVSTMVNWFSNSSKVTVFGPALRANSDGDALISISGFGGQGASPIWVTVEEE